jgi:hypothetical protein
VAGVGHGDDLGGGEQPLDLRQGGVGHVGRAAAAHEQGRSGIGPPAGGQRRLEGTADFGEGGPEHRHVEGPAEAALRGAQQALEQPAPQARVAETGGKGGFHVRARRGGVEVHGVERSQHVFVGRG